MDRLSSSEVREGCEGSEVCLPTLPKANQPSSLPVPGLLALHNFPCHLSGSSRRIYLLYPLEGPLDPHFPLPAPPQLFLKPSSETRQFVSHLSLKLLLMSVSSSRCIHLYRQACDAETRSPLGKAATRMSPVASQESQLDSSGYARSQRSLVSTLSKPGL